MMALDWKALLKDKSLWVVMGVGAVAGVYVLIRRKAATGSTATTGTISNSTPSGGYSTGSVGSFNSTGTDIAQWLGQYSGSLQTQLTEYSGNMQTQLTEYNKNLTEAIEGLKSIQTAPETPAAPVSTATSLLSTVDLNYDGHPWKRLTWSPVAGASSYRLNFQGDNYVYNVKAPVADWSWGKAGQKLTVTPIMADGTAGQSSVLTAG